MHAHERAALARKYRALLGLREAPSVAGRSTLRALATEFPGALRELDTLALDELRRRIHALDGTSHEPWMLPMARYHALMRTALAIRRERHHASAHADRLRADTGMHLDARDFATIARPPRGRLGVYVFDRLGAELGHDPATLWNALFPTSRRDRFAPRGRVP